MRIARIAISLAMVALAVTGTQFGASVGARADEDTISQNQLRDDWDSSEPGLSPAQVTSGKFGQLFATNVDGQVYAQPLVVDQPGDGSTPPGSSVIVATENDTVYSLNGATGAVQWETSVGTAWNSSVNACADLAPKIGITATPVYDPSTGTIYVMADNAEGNPNTTDPEFDFVAIDEQTGAIEWSKAVQPHPTNDPTMTFDSEVERQRVGLLLASNGWLYTTFAGICNHGPYAGFVAGVDAASDGGSQTLWTTESGNSSATPWGGIWMSGGGLVQVPGQPDSFYLTTGNGNARPVERGECLPRPEQSPAGRLGDPAGHPAGRVTAGRGLLQPGQRSRARRTGPGPGLRRADRPAGRNGRVPGPPPAGGQGRPGLPPERERPRWPERDLR